MQSIVADTTPLNYLVLIQAAEILPNLYRTVLIPPAVTTLDRTTIDMHSYPHGPSESKIERRSKTEAPRAFAPASRSGKHPAYRQLCAPFFFTGVRSTWHHLAAIQRPAHLARRRPGGASDTGHRREDDRTGTGYNPPVGSLGREEVRAPGTPFR